MPQRKKITYLLETEIGNTERNKGESSSDRAREEIGVLYKEISRSR